MPRACLWASVLLALGAHAWQPPAGPEAGVAPRLRRHAHSSTKLLRLGGWELELHENRAIRSPYYDECQFYKGRVLGETSSTATVTECSGRLYGLLQVGEEDFVLQPTTAHDGGHVLRRRDVLLSEEPTEYDLNGDTVADLDLDLEEDEPLSVPHVRPRHSDRAPVVDYLRSDGPVSRPISGALQVQLYLWETRL